MTRVLISHRYLWPENISLFPGMLKEIAAWHSERGDETAVFTAMPATSEARQQRRGWASSEGIQLLEQPLSVERGKSIVTRGKNTLRYARGLKQAIRSFRPDLLLYSSYPPMLARWITAEAKKCGVRKTVYYVQDIFPEMLALDGRRKKFAAGLLAQIDRRAVASADVTITLSEDMKQTLLIRRRATGTVRVVPNYAMDPPTPSVNSFRPTPRLIFAGNMGRAQGLGHLLRVVKLASSQLQFQVELLGGGGDLGRVKAMAESLELSNVIFSGQVPRAEAQNRIEQADIGVIGARPGLYRVALPSKMNSYLLAGLPTLIFAEHDSTVANWLRDHGLGGVASPSDVAAAARDLVGFVKAVRLGEYSRQTIAETASTQLSASRFFASYREIIEGLTARTRHHQQAA